MSINACYNRNGIEEYPLENIINSVKKILNSLMFSFLYFTHYPCQVDPLRPVLIIA